MFKYISVYTYLVLIFTSLFIGCDSTNSTESTQPTETNLISNVNHNITVIDFGDTISIVLEALRDTTNNLSGAFPGIDFTSIWVDINHNGQIDQGVDVGFSTIGGTASTICSVKMNSENSNSGCGSFVSDATLDAVFSSSETQSEAHTTWTYSIPKSEIFTDSYLTFTVKFFESGIGYTTYPLSNSSANGGSYSFDQVLTYP